MRFTGAAFIATACGLVALALGSAGYVLPCVAAMLTGILGVLIWLRWTDNRP